MNPDERKTESAGGASRQKQISNPALDALSTHICILDEHGEILFTNRAWNQFSDLNPPVVPNYGLGSNYLQVCDSAQGPDSELARQIADGIRAVMRGDAKVFSEEYPCHSPEKKRWFTVTVSPFVEDGALRVAVVHEDITNRTQAEESLRESQTLGSALIDSTEDLIWSVDNVNFGLMSWNKAFQDYFYNARGIKIRPGDRPEDLFPPGSEYIQTWKNWFEKALRESFSVEYQVFAGTRYLQLNFNKIVRDDQPIGISVFGRDITERKKALQLLSESEELFRNLTENLLTGVYILQHGRLVYVNWALASIFGYVPAELIGADPLILIDPADHARVTENIRLRLSGQVEVLHYEFRGRCKDGSAKNIDVLGGRCILDGQPALIGSLLDITERKNTEEAVLQKNQMLLAVHDVMLTIGVELDLPILLSKIMEEAESILNADRGGGIYLYDESAGTLRLEHGSGINQGRNGINVLPGQGVAGQVYQTGQPILVDDYPSWPLHATVLVDDPPSAVMGVPLILHERIFGVLTLIANARVRKFTQDDVNAAEMFAAQVAIAINNARLYEQARQEIAERKLVEKTLQERNRYIETIMENAPIGFAVHTIDDGIGRFVSSRYEEIYGVPRGTITSYLTFFEDVFRDPVFREGIKARVQADIESGDPARFHWENIPLKLESGEIRYISATNFPLFDQNLMVSTVQDVTEQVQAEQALHVTKIRLETIIDVSPLAIFLLDLQDRILLWNPAAVTTFGWTAAEVIGRPNPIIPAFKQDEYAMLRGELDSGVTITNLETVRQRKDGSLVDVSLSTAPIYDSNGNLSGRMTILADITERKEAEKAIQSTQRALEELNRELEKRVEERTAEVRQREATYRALFEGSNDGIFLMNTEGQDQDVNQHALSMLGYTLEEYLALPSDVIIPPEQQADSRQRLSAVVRGENVPLYERTLTRKDGPRLEVEINLSPVRDVNGNIFMVQSVVRDITERKKVQEELRESRDKLSAVNTALEKASRLKDEFLASMSHELRTPLTGILGLSEALQLQTYGALSEKQLKALKNIETSGRHLLELINDILDLSKIEAGKLDLQFEPCQLADICQASIYLVKGMAGQKNINISFSMHPNELLVRGDPRRLKQMLVNLLSNAIKFTPQGGKVGLDLQGDEQERIVRLTVWDNGIGIRQDDLPKLFQPFTQLDSSLARQHSGTGLGLSLVKRMAELHDGSIWVESIPGEGSRFTIVLPWSSQVTLPFQGLGRPGKDSTPMSMLIEDNPIEAEHISGYLKELGSNNIIHHATVKGALVKAAFLSPGVILLDLNLPDGYGLDLLSQLKADERTRNIPVIIISVEERKAEALKLGATGYLVKPFSQEDLHTELARVLTYLQPSESLRVAELNKTIMMADDNEMVLEIVSDFMQSKGYKVVATRSGFELLAKIAAVRPDIVLMDIQMPGMDGLETIRQLRSNPNPQIASVPIVAVTALAMTGDREKCLAAGANEYISKPIALGQLATWIEDFLKKKAK
jgi:PAS domain S-box-containing protein